MSESVQAIGSYQKKLEGVQVTAALLQLWKECYTHVQLKQSAPKSYPKDALSILKENQSPHQDPKWVPIDVIQALSALVDDTSVLEKALEQTSLVFSPPPNPAEETPEQKKFRQRMERLRLKHEETKYVKLTNNLQKEVQDDITAKSMTYAASVGLNMIVAPISFGGFMYMFAGGVLDYFLREEFSTRTTGGTDIKRVIVGVVSGVVMLFVEMLLFVIRTHEVESHTAKKKKKRKTVQPFGIYSKKEGQHAMPADVVRPSSLKKTS